MRFASAGIYAEKQKENISFQLGAMLLNKQDKQIHWNVAAKAHDDYLDTKSTGATPVRQRFVENYHPKVNLSKPKNLPMPTYISTRPN